MPMAGGTWQAPVLPDRRPRPAHLDALLAPDAAGLFLGDYTDLAGRGQRIWSAFAIPVAQNPTDILVRWLDLGGDD